MISWLTCRIAAQSAVVREVSRHEVMLSQCQIEMRRCGQTKIAEVNLLRAGANVAEVPILGSTQVFSAASWS